MTSLGPSRHTSLHVGFTPLLPIGQFGGGGSFIITLAAAARLAYFLSGMFTDSSRSLGRGSDLEDEDDGPTVVAKVQLGLLSSARQLQSTLNRLGDELDTNSSSGLS